MTFKTVEPNNRAHDVRNDGANVTRAAKITYRTGGHRIVHLERGNEYDVALTLKYH